MSLSSSTTYALTLRSRRDDSVNSCPLMEPLSPTQQPQPTLEEQALEVKQHRQTMAQQQVEAWQTAANTPLLDAPFKFLALLGEGCRHELENIRCCRGPRYERLTASEASLLCTDVKETYRRLAQEARKMFEQRRLGGCSHAQMQQIAAQAVASYSALYPWSDGITCRDMDMQHPHFPTLLARRSVSAASFQDGRSYAVMSSFSAALPISQLKLKAATERREHRLEVRVIPAAVANEPASSAIHPCSAESTETPNIARPLLPLVPTAATMAIQETYPQVPSLSTDLRRTSSRSSRRSSHIQKRAHHHATPSAASVVMAPSHTQAAANIASAARMESAAVVSRTLTAC